MDLFDIKAQADATVEGFSGLSDVQKAVIEYIAINDAMYRASTAPEAGNVYGKLLKEGTWSNPQKKPRKYPFGEIKQCYRNAFWLARDNADLTYCEGIAFMGIIPVAHAWVIDKDNNVIDTTWRMTHREVTNLAYFGIVIPTEELVIQTIKQKYYGLLFGKV
jgi:hypothetical protein